jgi:hypothetical protein
MSKTLSREVIEELERYKAGPAPRPRLRRSEVLIEANAEAAARSESADISQLVAALVMTTQQTLAAELRKPSVSSSLAA